MLAEKLQLKTGHALLSRRKFTALISRAPLTVLRNSSSGRSALASNFILTGRIQTGAIRQPTLLPFDDQRQQALRDAFITSGNLAQLADGLGTTAAPT
jgi:hypothetical protein